MATGQAAADAVTTAFTTALKDSKSAFYTGSGAITYTPTAGATTEGAVAVAPPPAAGGGTGAANAAAAAAAAADSGGGGGGIVVLVLFLLWVFFGACIVYYFHRYRNPTRPADKDDIDPCLPVLRFLGASADVTSSVSAPVSMYSPTSIDAGAAEPRQEVMLIRTPGQATAAGAMSVNVAPAPGAASQHQIAIPAQIAQTQAASGMSPHVKGNAAEAGSPPTIVRRA
jgi:hypothetical protein